MFDIGMQEILVIAVVAIIVVGPKDLPGLLRTGAKYIGQLRNMASDFKGQMNEAIKEADLADLKKLNPLDDVKATLIAIWIQPVLLMSRMKSILRKVRRWRLQSKGKPLMQGHRQPKQNLQPRKLRPRNRRRKKQPLRSPLLRSLWRKQRLQNPLQRKQHHVRRLPKSPLVKFPEELSNNGNSGSKPRRFQSAFN